MQSFRARVCALAAQRLRAPLPPGGKKGLDKGPAKIGQLSTEVVTGLSIKKGEADPPIRPDADYPDWLWQLRDPPATVSELERRYQKEGLSVLEMKRLFRYKNKQRIKEQNALRAKK